jgi:hypothetical protein
MNPTKLFGLVVLLRLICQVGTDISVCTFIQGVYKVSYIPGYLHTILGQTAWVDFGYRSEDGINLGGEINAKLDDSGNWQVWWWAASFQVKEMRTNDGSVDIEIGQIGWVGFNNNSSPDWARKLYSAMGDTVTRTIKSKLGDLIGLKNAHQFWVPGYENFIAQDPRFLDTRDLVIDMTMNG